MRSLETHPHQLSSPLASPQGGAGLIAWEEAMVCTGVLHVAVVCSEVDLAVTEPFSLSQSCSVLLNRSIQENRELRIESRIEEVSLLSVFCSTPSAVSPLSSFVYAGTFIVATSCQP